MTARQILERALDRYESGRYRWIRYGIYSPARHESTPGVCLVGSLLDDPADRYSYRRKPVSIEAENLLLQAIREVPSRRYPSVPSFNDARRTSERMAITALRRAVELAQPEVVQAKEVCPSVATDYRCPCCHRPLENRGAMVVGAEGTEVLLECPACPSYGVSQFVNRWLMFDTGWLRRYWEEVPAYDPAEHALR